MSDLILRINKLAENYKGKGSPEMAIFRDAEESQDRWNILIGNQSCVALGEVRGEYESIGYTLEEAVCNLELKLKQIK